MAQREHAREVQRNPVCLSCLLTLRVLLANARVHECSALASWSMQAAPTDTLRFVQLVHALGMRI